MIIGNKIAEKDIRDYLSNHGFFGRSAEFQELELHAIQRPGWLQVFRFRVRVKREDESWGILFGAMKDDERFGLNEIQLFDNVNHRDHLLVQWSRGLMQPKFKTAGDSTFSRQQYLRELAILGGGFAIVLLFLALLGLK